MGLGTTTWMLRNTPHMIRTKEVANELGLHNPTILDYGPGGMVWFLADYLPKNDRTQWTEYLRLKNNLLKFTDSVLRKTGLFSLETSEPKEIADLLQGLSPKQIYVLDKEERVIDAVKRISERNKLNTKIIPYLIDIDNEEFEQNIGDIVIAYNVVQRTKNPEKTLERIAKTTRIGGILSVNIPYAPEGFREVREEVYYRLH